MSELKPCPFCGSEVQDDERGEKYPKKSPMGGWIIHCECCGASLSQFRKSGKDEISWNTRPIEDVLNKRIAELNEALRIRLVANDELPEAKESVLALVKEKWSGELYIERACYIPPKSIRADDFFLDDLEDESVEEYDEELDLYWVAEGWWEDSHEANVNWKITGEVIGWWSLPKIEVEGCYTESTTMG